MKILLKPLFYLVLWLMPNSGSASSLQQEDPMEPSKTKGILVEANCAVEIPSLNRHIYPLILQYLDNSDLLAGLRANREYGRYCADIFKKRKYYKTFRFNDLCNGDNAAEKLKNLRFIKEIFDPNFLITFEKDFCLSKNRLKTLEKVWNEFKFPALKHESLENICRYVPEDHTQNVRWLNLAINYAENIIDLRSYSNLKNLEIKRNWSDNALKIFLLPACENVSFNICSLYSIYSMDIGEVDINPINLTSIGFHKVNFYSEEFFKALVHLEVLSVTNIESFKGKYLPQHSKLKHLKLHIDLAKNGFMLENLSLLPECLLSLDIDLVNFNYRNDQSLPTSPIALLPKLPHLRELKIGYYCDGHAPEKFPSLVDLNLTIVKCEVLDLLKFNNFPGTLHKLELEFESNSDDSKIAKLLSNLAGGLSSASNLRVLVLNVFGINSMVFKNLPRYLQELSVLSTGIYGFDSIDPIDMSLAPSRVNFIRLVWPDAQQEQPGLFYGWDYLPSEEELRKPLISCKELEERFSIKDHSHTRCWKEFRYTRKKTGH